MYNDFHDLHRERHPVGAFARHSAGAINIPNLATTIIIYEDEVWDPTGSYNPATGIYTCPLAGVYHVGAVVMLELNNALTCGEPVYFSLWRSGSLIHYLERKDWWNTGGATFFPFVKGDALILASAGDTLYVGVYQASGGALLTNPDGTVNYIQFQRRGPYNP